MNEEEYRELYELKGELHEMLKEIIIKSGIGDIEEDYSDSVSLDFAGGIIYSCPHYEQLMFCDADGEEYELDNDLENTGKLFKEIQNRYKKLNLKMGNVNDAASDIFDQTFKIEDIK